MAKYRVAVNAKPQDEIEASSDTEAVDLARIAFVFPPEGGEFDFHITDTNAREVSRFSCFHEPVTPASPTQ